MADDVTVALRKALTELESQRERLDQKITAIRAVLGGGMDGRPPAASRGARRRRRRMSAEARKAVSDRMRAYWAQRRAAKAGKGKRAAR
jgi:tagatose-1,6-bisphosphate aldolase non-catalytic subunit AgaZ/GatZ